MNSKLKEAIKIILFLALGGFIFWLVYRGQNIDHMKQVLANDVNYWWVLLSLVLGLLSHVSRTLRWRMLIKPLGKTPTFINSFLAVMVGYLMNLAIPRMGEISRCGVLTKYEGFSFTQLIGTVVTERIIDVIMLLLLTAFVFFAQFNEMLTFLQNNPEIQEKVSNFSFSPIFIGVIILLIIGVILLFTKGKNTGFVLKIKNTLRSFAEGLQSIRNMEHKWIFILHSIFIWLMYYLMIYVVFFAFDFTSNLPWIAGLTVFVMSAYGMVAPVQGGIGAWHFMVIQGLYVYGIDKANGSIFAFLAHSSMNIMIVIVGLIAMMLLPILNKPKETSPSKL